MLEQKLQQWAEVPHAIQVAWNYQKAYSQWRLRVIQGVLGITGFLTSVWGMYTFWGDSPFGAYLLGLGVAALWFLLYIAILYWLHSRESQEWAYMRQVDVKEATDMMEPIPMNAWPTVKIVPDDALPRPFVLRAWEYMREESAITPDEMEDDELTY